MKYFLLSFLFISIGLNAQKDNRYTEKEIAAQSEFIKASQKKLIGKLDDAIKIYEAVLEKDPHNSAALFDLSRIYLEKGIKDEAISYAKKAVKKAPQDLWYKESLAEINMEFNEFPQAATLYNDLISLDKFNQSHYLNAIEAYRKSNNIVATLEVFQRMETVFGADSYSIQQSMELLYDAGMKKEALTKALQLLELYPNDPDYILLNAELQTDFGSQEKAKALYEDLLRIDPHNSEALMYKTRISGPKDELSNIELIVDNPSINIDSKVKPLIPWAAKITSTHPQKDRLIAIAHKIVEVHPEEAKAYTLLADFLANSGNPEEAETNYIRALELDKSVFTVWLQLMFIQNDLGKYDALGKSSLKALDYYPNQAAPYVFNGLAQTELSNYKLAKEMQQEALLIGTNNAYVRTHLRLLTGKVEAHVNGEEVKEMTKAEIVKIGLNENDTSILMKLKNGNYLVRIQKGS